jgi:hypothetical protein
MLASMHLINDDLELLIQVIEYIVGTLSCSVGIKCSLVGEFIIIKCMVCLINTYSIFHEF